MRLYGDSKWYKKSHDPWSAKPTTLVEKLDEKLPRLGHRLGLMSLDEMLGSWSKVITRL